MPNRLIRPVVFVAAMWMLSSLAFAQTFEVYGPSAQGKRTPKSTEAAAKATPPKYDPHDLSGVWWGARNSILMTGQLPAMTAWGKQQYDTHHPSRGPRAVVPALTDDPMAHCDPLGYPRNLYIDTRAFELIQLPNKVVQTFEWAHGGREIYTDGRKLPDTNEADPTWFGYAVGTWQGDADFVVDSTGYDERAWIDSEGDPRSESGVLHEVFHHPDALTLELTMTYTDPMAYTKPWMGGKQTFHMQLPKGVTMLKEEYCVPDEELSFNDNVRNPAGGVLSKK
jgi:hypothetical protein